MKNKIVSADEAVAILRDGDTLANTGFVGNGAPEELLLTLERRFVETGGPRDLTLMFAAGQGDGKERGLNRLGHDGLLKRVVGGHWGLIPKVGALARENRIEAYNLPQGVISHLYRDIAAGRPGTITKVGLRTFVDPRVDGGKVNDATTEDLVEVIELGGEEWLFYKAFPINVAFVRGTTADPAGNITMEKEALVLDNLAMAMAARNSGGFVIAQVERIAEAGSLNPRQVQVPGALVDCIVVAETENHAQTYAVQYDPAYASEIRVPLESLAPMPLDERKIIARRCAFELPAGGVVNLGIGMPEGVAAVANEEKILKFVTLTAEPGVIGGVPASGLNFGAAVNTDAIIQQNQQFDFYDGGGLDMACLGLAQCDRDGDLQAACRKRSGEHHGAGVLADIDEAPGAGELGAETADVEIAVADGHLTIVHEGQSRKFVDRVEQITFSGAYAAEIGQRVYYVTERCVFALSDDGLSLIEVAPGIDIERDILAHMDFQPIVDAPGSMDPRIFLPTPMGLEDDLVGELSLGERIGWDASREILFLNFEGLAVRSEDDVDAIRNAVEERCREIGKRVAVVVNYDSFRIEEPVLDAYARMVRYMEAHHYTTVTRYTTSAFMRMKLGEALARRDVAPHVFETEAEAKRFLDRSGR